MASVYMRGSKFYARWKDHTGKWRHQITACTRRRDAERFAEDLQRLAERQRAGLEPLPSRAPQKTFGELFDWWFEEYGANLRGKSEGFIRQRLLPKMGALSLSDITPAQIEGLLQGYAEVIAEVAQHASRCDTHNLLAPPSVGFGTGPTRLMPWSVGVFLGVYLIRSARKRPPLCSSSWHPVGGRSSPARSGAV